MNSCLKTLLSSGALLTVCAAAVLLSAGCQSEDKVIRTQTSQVCPTCKLETRIQPITGLEYTTCVCPSCKKVSTLDPDLRDKLERFVGGSVGETVTVCDNCKAVVAECAVCREGHGS